MRVLLDVRHASASGIGRVTRDIAPAVVALLQQEGHSVVALRGPGSTDAFGSDQSVQSSAMMYSVSEFARLGSLVDAQTCNAFLTLHYPSPIRLRTPLYALVHDDFHTTSLASRGQRIYSHYMFGHLRRHARHVFANSAFTKSQLVLRHGYDPTSITVASPALPRAISSVSPPSSNRRAEPAYVAFVGNLKRHKNLPVIASALEHLRASGLDVGLKVIGAADSDRDQADLRRQFERLEVDFLGTASDDVLAATLSGAVALIQPSLYEGFGLPPLEAMHLGCPVIASRAGSLPEVCDDAALYFDPHDAQALAGAIQRLLGSEQLTAELRSRGRQQVARFSWESAAEKIVARIIEDVA